MHTKKSPTTHRDRKRVIEDTAFRPRWRGLSGSDAQRDPQRDGARENDSDAGAQDDTGQPRPTSDEETAEYAGDAEREDHPRPCRTVILSLFAPVCREQEEDDAEHHHRESTCAQTDLGDGRAAAGDGGHR